MKRMKAKNLTTMILTALIAVCVCVSCSKEESGAPEGGDGTLTSVYLRLSEPEEPVSYAGGNPITAATENITLREGHLFFASNNLVTKYVKIVSSTPGTGEVSISGLSTGTQIDNVPSNSTQIFLLSNIPSTVVVPTAVSTPVATLKAVQIAAASMGKTDGSVDNVSLYGHGTIGPNSSGNVEDPQEAEVTVHAVASRIEIAKITGSGKVDDFSVAGIYLNHYYEKTSVDGATGEGVINHQSDVSKYVTGATGGYDFQNGILHDDFNVSPYSGALASVTKSVIPTSPSTVWAYQVLPTETAPLVPHIIIVLEDVVIDGVALSGQQYLTIRGFKTGSQELDELEKGYVYKIAEVSFTEDNVTDQPEVGAFKVDVKLELTKWKFVDLTVDWDK